MAETGSAIVVFNPTSSTRTDLVNLTLELPPGVEAFDLVDEHGAILPYQAHGLGSREFIHMIMDARRVCMSAFGSISDGRAAGMTIQDVRIRREGSQVHIDAIMADGGEPNLAAWKAGRKQIDEILTDPAVTEYHVRARSIPATQILFTAPQVPGLGYRTFWLRPRPDEETAPIRVGGPLVKALLPLARLPSPAVRWRTRQRKARPPYRIENEFLAVEAGADGTLTVVG